MLARRRIAARNPRKELEVESHSMFMGLLGGAMVGLAAGSLLLFNGRIAGISGIYGGMLQPMRGDGLWRSLFVAGLLAGGLVLRLVHPAALPGSGDIPVGSGVLVVAGLLVGFGTQMGSGCTSGHGVCGMSRLSPRSFVATGVFMAAGMLTVLVSRHVLGG
jgi:hypothetical protein